MIGASISVSVEYGTEPGCVDAVALMMKAMVPGPAVPGSASGTNAILTGLRRANASVLASASGMSFVLCVGNSMVNPMNATINPTAIRRLGMVMLNERITHIPATHKSDEHH